MVKISNIGAYRLNDNRGLWPETLVSLGASPRYFTGYHGPCPFCGGDDRYRWLDGDRNNRRKGQGIWLCSQCQPKSADGIEFIKRLRGLSYAEARELREEKWSKLGSDGCPLPALPAPSEDVELQKEFAEERLREWSSALPLTQWSPPGKYLMRRTGIVPWTDDLRVQRPETEIIIGEGKSRKARKAFLNNDAVMLALFRASHGRSTIHRTYIKDGQKVGTRYARGPMPTGGAVELLPVDPRKVLGIAEGIETALSAAKLFSHPVWAALDARNLSNWEPPAAAEQIIIYGDNDENGVGQDAAERLRARLVTQGRKVLVKIPEKAGADWNDVYQEGLVEPFYLTLLGQRQKERVHDD